MRGASPSGGWPKLRGARRQRGQALIYGLFVLIGGLSALFFLFNTGQLAREKTKLVNTSDAVAYSAGVMHARALNFEAYTNRAMVANTVAIAQLVSLSSWVQYVKNLGTYGSIDTTTKYPAFYAANYFAQMYGSDLDDTLNDEGRLEDLVSTSDQLIRDALMKSQQGAYEGLLRAREKLMNEVAQANYRNDGTVSVDLVSPTANEFMSFVSRYSGDDRTRFAEVARVSAFRDRFVEKRSWPPLPALHPNCSSAWPRTDWLDRHGGTALVGFDEWKAMDTLSEKVWVSSNWTDVFCLAISETPEGWGRRVASDNPSSDPDLAHPEYYDYSFPINPGASATAVLMSSSSWDYSGLPNFYELSESALESDDPRLKFAIRVRRDKSQTVTSEGRSAIRNTPRLNAYQATPAGGSELVAVSVSEVFFQRDGDARENEYGRPGKPREIGSLFNPFWQVHLIQSDADVREAQLKQGAVLP